MAPNTPHTPSRSPQLVRYLTIEKALQQARANDQPSVPTDLTTSTIRTYNENHTQTTPSLSKVAMTETDTAAEHIEDATGKW